MRHHKKSRKFDRTSSHRASMFRNMTISLIKYEIIKTTLPKAKELRRIIEPLITISKVDTVANRRLVFSRIRKEKIVSKLFNIIGLHFKNHPGGYTRILKLGNRTGNFSEAYIEFVNRTSLKKNLKKEEKKN